MMNIHELLQNHPLFYKCYTSFLQPQFLMGCLLFVQKLFPNTIVKNRTIYFQTIYSQGLKTDVFFHNHLKKVQSHVLVFDNRIHTKVQVIG